MQQIENERWKLTINIIIGSRQTRRRTGSAYFMYDYPNGVEATLIQRTMKYIILLLIFLPSIAIADSYTIEVRISAFSLKDQHGNQYEVDETTSLILFSKDMKGGKIIRTGLKETYRDYLSNHNTVFIADISGMPLLIRKFVALPKMRKYPYSILLDMVPSVTKDLPSQPDKATLIYVRNLRITDIQYVGNPDLIRPAIDGLSPTHLE